MKKSFWIGLITGLIISLVIGCAVLSVNVLINGNGAGARNAEETVRRTVEEKLKNSDKDKSDDKKGDEKADKDKEETAKVDEDETTAREPGSSDGYVLEDSKVTEKIMLLEDYIDNYYVEGVDNEQIEEGIYEGIMDSLGDPYAAYYSAEDYKDLMESTEGKYGGVGAYLQYDTTVLYPKVTGFISGSPSESSDLRVGDYIVKVDGVSIFDMDLSESVALIRGEEGTTVTLSVVRQATGDEFEVTLERKIIESPTVEYKMLDDKIAYIQIKEFDLVTSEQFAEALANAKGAKMKGLIIDLRGNPGGSVAAVGEIGRMILPKGLVVYMEDKYGHREEIECDGKHELDVPLVVLVDGNSASASEILAGAVKDYGIGTIMGTTTYGKGIVQSVIGLGDGSAIKMTVSHYYTPLGNDIHKLGIEPDVEVKFDYDAYLEDQDNDNQLDEAVKYLKKEIK